MWLAWDTAAIVAISLALLSVVAARYPGRKGLTVAGAVAKEAAVIIGLYALWQWAGGLAVTKVNGAVAHATWIWHVEQWLHLPSEASVQRMVLPYRLLVEALNGFYAIVHVPALIVFLIWLFVRHRDRYAAWRNVGAVLTGASLLIQMIPVAPPRLLPSLGFVDTGVLYHQSVYGANGISIAPQLAAMPSVHVAWAGFIALVVIRVSPSRWRWLVLAHPALTTWAVVATANHWWLDGIVGAALLPPSLLVVSLAAALAARVRVRARLQPVPAAIAAEH